MARIRSIKPEFWRHRKTTALTRDARLLLVGLWNLVDDAGIMELDLAVIRADLFLRDADVTEGTIGAWLSELERAKWVVTYEAQGTNYLAVVNFREHQKPNHPTPSKLPPPPDNPHPVSGERSRKSPEPSGSPTVGVPTGEEGRGDGVGEEGRGGVGDARPSGSLPTPPESLQIDAGASKTPESPSEPSESSAVVPAPRQTRGGVLPLPPRKDKTALAVRDQISEVMAEIRAGTRERLSIEQARQMSAGLVFSYWQAKTNANGALLDDKRERRIMARLKENDDQVSELLYAIDGALREPWHNGSKDGTKRLQIDHIFRDRERIEVLSALVPKFKAGEPHHAAERIRQIISGEAT